MLSSTTIVLLFCIATVSVHALERCPGASSDSQDDFKWKYDTAPIVVYGTASDVKNNMVTLTINCVLKGSVPVNKVDVPQLPDVTNITECHYLSANKNYIVFLESMKTSGPGNKSIYRLADLEEIEINTNTAKSFMDNECADEDDYGIEMTMFYADNNVKCNQFTATCNEATKTSILALNYPPLTKSTILLGGYKKDLGVPNSDSNDASISGKNNGGTGDEQLRNTAMMATSWMSCMVVLTGLLMMIHV